MRRMLDPTKVGGLPSTIEFDKDGNRKVKKNLGVGGKLTLNSLVSDSNPDGDITKELGGGLAVQQITASSPNLSIRAGSYKAGDTLDVITSYISTAGYEGKTTSVIPIVCTSTVRDSLLCMFAYADVEDNNNRFNVHFIVYFFKDITLTSNINLYMSLVRYYISA